MLDDAALDLIFRKARTYRGSSRAWTSRPVEDATLQQVWDLARMGPTSANCSPARIVFVKTPAAKAELAEALDPGNVEQSMAAPVTAVVGMDIAFAEKLGYLYPSANAASWFEGNPALTQATAFRNASLQGAYLIIAARALGLDCGPMSGFDAAKVDAAFFSGTAVRSNFLINLGYGERSTLRPRDPRLSFEEACRIA